MRSYGSDKPDCRIPPMHPVEDLLPELAAGMACRWWPSTFPNTGALSRKERDELKAFGTGARPARLRRSASAWNATIPGRWRKCASARARPKNDLLMLAAWAGEPKGQRPEETVYQACGQLRLYCRAEIQRPPQAARPAEFPIPLGGRFSHVRMGRGREPLERRAPSVHFGARRGSRQAHQPIRRAAAPSPTTWC